INKLNELIDEARKEEGRMIQ
ncbi:hypothetical protein, partial [Staphylococcus aureus]